MLTFNFHKILEGDYDDPYLSYRQAEMKLPYKVFNSCSSV